MKTNRDFGDDMAAILRHATATGETVAILDAAGDASSFVCVPGPVEFPCCEESREEIAALRRALEAIHKRPCLCRRNTKSTIAMCPGCIARDALATKGGANG